MGERYPFKAVLTLTKKKDKKDNNKNNNKDNKGVGREEKEENYYLSREPSWEHKALSGSDLVFLL